MDPGFEMLVPGVDTGTYQVTGDNCQILTMVIPILDNEYTSIHLYEYHRTLDQDNI